jgi:hypothetical protein
VGQECVDDDFAAQTASRLFASRCCANLRCVFALLYLFLAPAVHKPPRYGEDSDDFRFFAMTIAANARRRQSISRQGRCQGSIMDRKEDISRALRFGSTAGGSQKVRTRVEAGRIEAGTSRSDLQRSSSRRLMRNFCSYECRLPRAFSNARCVPQSKMQGKCRSSASRIHTAVLKLNSTLLNSRKNIL